MPHITARPLRIGYAPHGKLFTIPAYTRVIPARSLPAPKGQRRYWVAEEPAGIAPDERDTFHAHRVGHGILVDQCDVIYVNKKRHAALLADPILAILNSNPNR